MKGLVLFSGGLDSILAVKVLRQLNIEVKGVTFISYFFDSKIAEKSAKSLGLKLKVVNFSKEHLKIVEEPHFGYGSTMNPCIDCHILMLKKTKEIMDREDWDFVATGEVLGERPMSQNKNALVLIEKEAGLKGRLLRPLSAKLLEPTILEKKGLIDREKLLDIQGRSRKVQLTLAKQWNIKNFPAPAGGCLLTDPGFSRRLKKLFEMWPDCQGKDIELLKIGRVRWIKNSLIVIGRDQEENKKIADLAKTNDILIKLKDYPGPLTLIRGKAPLDIIKKAAQVTARYSTKARNLDRVLIKYWSKSKSENEISVKPEKY
jgi:tRNA U34 2-thiouridine synthase MnmA/TrmU